MMMRPDIIVPGYNDHALGSRYRDPDDLRWFSLIRIPNISWKTIDELVAAGLIEGRHPGHTFWYRLLPEPSAL